MDANNDELTEEQRQEVREKYGTNVPDGKPSDVWKQLEGKYGDTPAMRKITSGSLSALGWTSAVGWVLAIVSLFAVNIVESPTAALIWSGLIGPGVLAGVLGMVAFFATRAIIASRKG